MKAAGCDTDPIFLVGAERSGSTMLRIMLDHHPEIAFFSEFEFAVERVSESGDFPEIGSYRRWLQSDRIYLDSGSQVDATLGYRDLVHSFLEQKRSRDGKRLVGATVHRCFDRLVHLWPNARYIHLLRDPRDVARSTIAMGWAGNVWTGAERWVNAETTWGRLRNELPCDRWFEIRYESLVREPEAQLRELCGYLSVPYDARMLGYPETTSYDAPNPHHADRWMQSLPDRDAGLVEQRIGSLLTDRGYTCSADQTPAAIPIGTTRQKATRPSFTE